MTNKILGTLKTKFDDMSILRKILLSTLTIVIVFFCTIGYVAYYFSRNVIEEQAKVPIRDALDTVKNNVEIYLGNTVLTVNSIKHSIDVKDIFPLDTKLDKNELEKRYNELMWDSIDPIRQQFEKIMELQFVSFILDNGSQFNDYASPFYYQTAVTTCEQIKKEEWYIQSQRRDSSSSSSEYENIKWFTKKVVDQNNNQYIIATCNAINGGVIAVGFKISQIEEFLSGTSSILIIDAEGKVIYSKDSSEFGQDISQKPYVKKILSGDKGQFGSSIDGNGYLVTFNTLDTRSNNSWRIASLVPEVKLTSDAAMVRRIIMLTVIACITLAALLSVIIARGITKPIRVLVKSMKKIKDGNLEVTVDRQAKDEIGELYRTFNKMIRDINNLIKEIYKSERHLKEIEIKFLQSQINPHFLYNTLNTIKWLGIIHKVPTISQVSTDLVKLLRNSIGKEGYMITVEGEIENLHSYVCIQQVRYNDVFQIHYDLEEEILGLYVYKLILQPIVENSINYAFNTKKVKSNIGIKGYLEDEKLVLEVWDDGDGFGENQMKSLLEQIDSGANIAKSKERFSGIGLKNIQDRIRLSYGNDYGISVQSIPGEGTRVILRLPIIRHLDLEVV
jgi:sensor histidine kinase YesM